MNNILWKDIISKGEVTSDSFWNYAYVSSYLRKFLEKTMETRLRNILRTANVTEFIKTILESSYKVLLGPYTLATPTLPVFF